MLNYIYARLAIVLEWLGKIFRSAESQDKRLRSVEQKLNQLAIGLAENTVTLTEIRDAVVPGQATQVRLMAGPIEEQP